MNRSQKTDNLVLVLFAFCGVLIHILLNGQYGFHRDELDFIMSARRLDWGYVSYPPITPFFARIGLELFGESLRGLRVLPAIAQGIAMVLAGLMARDMGGKRNAQLLAAFAVFISPISLKKRRMEKFQKQLPAAMELIARALKAGHAFTSGLRMVADELGDPIGPEFEKTLQEINFGMGVPEALKNLPERVDCPDLRFFIISVILQRETGGNLAEILEKIAQIIQERFKLQAHIRVLSAEWKLSSIILIALPFVITIALYVLNPIYVKTLSTDPLGKIMIAYALLMMVMGIFVMKRMITIKV